eukprot:jgi/Tetstr1/447047/TSEL_003675.t1
MQALEAGEGWDLPDGGGRDGDIASHLSVAPRTALHSPTELRALGVCAVRRARAPEADRTRSSAPPCELRVRLVQGGCRVSTVEVVSSAGLAEVYVQGERDAAPSYLSTARAEVLDIAEEAGEDVPHGEMSLPAELKRIVLQVPHSPTWQRVHLKLQSLIGDKACLQLAVLALHVAEDADPGAAARGSKSATRPDECSHQIQGQSSESQMDGVRSFLDGILQARHAPADGVAAGRPVSAAGNAPKGAGAGQPGGAMPIPTPNMPSSMKGLIASLAKARSLGNPQPGYAAPKPPNTQPADAAAGAPMPGLMDAMQEQAGGLRQAVSEAASQLAAAHEAAHEALGARMGALEAATRRIRGQAGRVWAEARLYQGRIECGQQL